MARRIRYTFPGAVYHVMMRGNNGQSIFSSDEERAQFFSLMEEGVERYGHRILAFCFMTNHVHLAIQIKEVSLSKICQNVSFRCTKYYNRRHETVGHLFQGRFRSILVHGSIHLKKLIRYIHLNPIRAELVSDPAEYTRSSHPIYLGQRECRWIAWDKGLQLFGKTYEEALDQYSDFIAAGIGLEESIDFKRGISSGIVADEQFIEQIEARYINQRRGIDSSKLDLKAFIKIITDWYEIDPEALSSPRRDRKTAKIRFIMAYLVRYMGGITIKAVALYCNRAENVMSQGATRLEAQIANSEQLREEIEEVKGKLILAIEAQLSDQFETTSTEKKTQD